MCSQLGIVLKATPTQSHNSLSLCEIYHSPIKRVYRKLQNDDPDQDKHERLALSVHPVSNTAGPDGLTSSILVYGSVPYTVHAYGNEKTVYVMTDKVRPFSVSKIRLIPRSADENQVQVTPSPTSLREDVDNNESPDSLTENPSRRLPWISGEFPDVPQKFGSFISSSSPLYGTVIDSFLPSPISHSTFQSFPEREAHSVYVTVMMKNELDPRFNEAKIKEINISARLGTYEIVPETEHVSRGTVLQSRFS